MRRGLRGSKLGDRDPVLFQWDQSAQVGMMARIGLQTSIHLCVCVCLGFLTILN